MITIWEERSGSSVTSAANEFPSTLISIDLVAPAEARKKRKFLSKYSVHSETTNCPSESTVDISRLQTVLLKYSRQKLSI